jgi:hypothetical protein
MHSRVTFVIDILFDIIEHFVEFLRLVGVLGDCRIKQFSVLLELLKIVVQLAGVDTRLPLKVVLIFANQRLYVEFVRLSVQINIRFLQLFFFVC